MSGNAGTFKIETFQTDSVSDYLVDTATISPVTMTSGVLTNPSVTTNSSLAYDNNVLYTLSFTSINKVVANGIVDITIPSEVVLTDSASAISGCRGSVNGTPLSSLT